MKLYLKFFKNDRSSFRFKKDESEKLPPFNNTNLKISEGIPQGTYNACIFINSDGTANLKLESKENEFDKETDFPEI